MTVNEVMEITGQKRGTVEQFRTILQSYSLISNHESMDRRSVEAFKNAIRFKDQDNSLTWLVSMQKAILLEYGEEMVIPFNWSNNIILKHLIWCIKNEHIQVEKVSLNSPDESFHIVYELIIDNFREISTLENIYDGSEGTDGNPVTSYMCKGEDYIYIIAGKYNHITKAEDINVFYNEGSNFNIMKCKYVCGGNCDKGRIHELYEICKNSYIGKSSNSIILD